MRARLGMPAIGEQPPGLTEPADHLIQFRVGTINNSRLTPSRGSIR
jgi:hypothetical protein